MIKRTNFYLISIMYLASSLLMIFANNVKILGSNRFLWAPAVLLYSLFFYNNAYRDRKVFYALLYGLLYCGILQYTLWVNANDWYKRAILEDFYFLIHEIGIEDSLPLLSLASNRQMEYLLDLEVWEIFGQIKAELQKLGKPIDDMDILIAATAKNISWCLLATTQI